MSIENLLKKNFDLTKLTTFRIGGQAEFFAAIKNERELVAAAGWAKAKKLPLSVLAGGSNILITRKKITGLVLKIFGEQYSIKKNIIFSWAGTGLTKLAKISADAGLYGLEWAFGIPGSLGGAVRGNAGAYGGDISKNIIEVTVYDISKDKFIKLNNKACCFTYRHSMFKQNKNLLIVNISLKMKPGEPKEIKKIIANNFRHRLQKQPKYPSAGCVFKNLQYEKVVKQNRKLAEYLAVQGLVKGGKVGVGHLIDQLGLKGKTMGGAKVSEQHANFIVNTGEAQAKDVVNLIKLIKTRVKYKYKIDLEEEIQYF